MLIYFLFRQHKLELYWKYIDNPSDEPLKEIDRDQLNFIFDFANVCILYRLFDEEINEILLYAKSKHFWRKKTKVKMNNNFLSKDQMKKLTTKRLLAYKTKLMSYHETPDWDDPDSVCKTSNSWKEAYANLKSVLATRENLKKK